MTVLISALAVSALSFAAESAPKRQPNSAPADMMIESSLNNLDGMYYTRITDQKNHNVCYAITPSVTNRGMPGLFCVKEHVKE